MTAVAPAVQAAFLDVVSGGARFRVPLAAVREAVRAGRITPLPGAPAHYAGLALVRGEPRGVVRVAALHDAARDGLLVVLEKTPHALLVDSILGVRRAGEDASGDDAPVLDLDALLRGAP